MRGMRIARVFLLFSFAHRNVKHSCALVHWFKSVSDEPDELTGMWVVSPQFVTDDQLSLSVIRVETIIRAAHLIPCFGDGFVASRLDADATHTLDNFNLFYVNKYVDHHASETVY